MWPNTTQTMPSPSFGMSRRRDATASGMRFSGIDTSKPTAWGRNLPYS